MQELDNLWNDKTSITLNRSKYSYDEWTCEISRMDQGIRLEVTASAPTSEEAMRGAVKKFHKALNSGVPELQPALEYSPLEYPEDQEPGSYQKAINLNDGVQF